MSAAPEPFTTRDCDLRGMPFMPLLGEQLVESRLFFISSGDEFKAAVTLWWASWKQVPAASLPADERELAGLAKVEPRRWARVRTVAMHGWVLCADGRYYHPVVAGLAREAWTARLGQRARTEAARAAKLAKANSATGSVTEDVTASVTSSKYKGQGQGQKKEEEPSQGEAIHNGRGSAGASIVPLRAGDR